jgi:hypothetical protein
VTTGNGEPRSSFAPERHGKAKRATGFANDGMAQVFDGARLDGAPSPAFHEKNRVVATGYTLSSRNLGRSPDFIP